MLQQFFARGRRSKPDFDSLLSPSSISSSANIRLALPTAFPAYLASAKRILCLTGAGLSVASGIATFRDSKGKDRFWRDYQVGILSTHQFFVDDPATSWLYHASRRNAALKAQPNGGHEALARLAEQRRDDMLVINQNIDGLLERAGMETGRVNLHGSFGDVRCADDSCSYFRFGDTADAVGPSPKVSDEDISDLARPLPAVSRDQLPHCPICKHSLLRPGILWFGEPIPKEKLERIEKFMKADEKIDLMIVVGTSAMVSPAADYVHRARKSGAKIAVFDLNMPVGTGVLQEGDWFFEGDASVSLPRMLEELQG
ncbi:hypothetical protein FKW77_002126 [Venturia effusa]|uniref:Deacetylase sirtuin-type domain-containing protein n=1 Tax=Venturia effusa TaxID=50376 RepID=A0A517LKX9_9PEZI|nr:hypothetical protein FKW77_002126 [Venturia effusa]